MAASSRAGMRLLNVARNKCSYLQYQWIRRYSTPTKGKGLVLGVFEGEKVPELTKAASAFNSSTGDRFVELLEKHGSGLKKGKSRLFYDVGDEYSSVVAVCLGKADQGYSELEAVQEMRESIRTAMAAGTLSLREVGLKEIEVDPCGDAEAAAEGVNLALYNYEELKAADKHKPSVDVGCHDSQESDTAGQWSRGLTLAQGQNLARRLAEMPANYLTPTRFGEIAVEELGKVDNVEVNVRDEAWAKEKKMGSFLSVTRGSAEPPVFLDMFYKGGKEGELPLALVGKGVTFDSGGISIKPSANMDAMRGDMGGAAATLGAFVTIAKLKLPINIRAFIPLCENMPSGTATKPGDVVTAMNGKTIQVDNTDAEGRLILADALCYAETFQPKAILDMATLTGAMAVALGPGATGTFTNSTQLWEQLEKAGMKTGDRMWRMPLWKAYTKMVSESQLADLNNIGTGGRGAGACTAAAFLKEFVSKSQFLHLDIAGVMDNKGEVPYLGKGMSGRPTRTIVELVSQLSQEK